MTQAGRGTSRGSTAVRRRRVAVAVVAALGLLGASCGFAPSEESAGLTGAAAQLDGEGTLEDRVDTDGDGEMSDEEIAAYAQAVLLDFSDCMRENGFPDFTDLVLEDLTEGDGAGQGRFLGLLAERGVTFPDDVPTIQLCGENLSDLQTFAPQPSDDELEEREAIVLEFAACMRSEGIREWPDPDFANNGGNGYGPELFDAVDVQSDEVQETIATCQAQNSAAVDVGEAPEDDSPDDEADAANDDAAVDVGDAAGDDTTTTEDDTDTPADDGPVERTAVSPLIEGDTSELNIAEVTRRDLVQTTTFSATLGYGAVRPFPTNTTGIVTALPDDGDVIGFGETLFSVDGHPVVLLEGDVPQYRPFEVGMTNGVDVEQLEQNLLTLGHGGAFLTVDGDFDDGTADAISTMLLSLGADPASIGELRPLPTNTTGVVTALPNEGDVIEFGQALFWVNGQPVVLLQGDSPQYRPFNTRTGDGADVEQLEQNLVDLGHTDTSTLTVDDDFTNRTSDAIEALQLHLGAEETGQLDLGHVVFADAPITVGAVNVSLGQQISPQLSALSVYESGLALGRVVFSAEPIRIGTVNVELGQSITPQVTALGATEADQRITLDVDADDLGLVPVDTLVEIEMPDGSVVAGRVSDVAAVATQTVNQQGVSGDPTTEVTIVFADGAPSDVFDAAPVDIVVTKEVSAAVLTVPVPALVALSGGGHAVELVVDGGTQLVSVELGDFVDDLVEIRGGLAAGDRVVMAGS